MSERQSAPRKHDRKKGGKILPALCNVLGTLIILLVIALLLPATLSKVMGYEVYNVISGSMEPVIPEGSMVFVKPTEWQEIESGDVIAFQTGASVTTHRVMRVHSFEGEFITKGDANETEDISPIPFDSLIGRVEYHVPVLGEVTALLASPLGKIYMFAFLLCGVLFNVLAGRLRDN